MKEGVQSKRPRIRNHVLCPGFARGITRLWLSFPCCAVEDRLPWEGEHAA